MAGCYFDPDLAQGEWNMIVDPVATALAFRRAPRGHRCVGLDVTLQVQMGREEVEERFSSSDVLRVVLEMAGPWFELREAVSLEPTITFHDPLAAAVIFDPGFGVTPPPAIVVLESINVDLVTRVPRFPAPGETVGEGAFARLPGGKGANQATAAVRLGARSALVGCVGDAVFGRDLAERTV